MIEHSLQNSNLSLRQQDVEHIPPPKKIYYHIPTTSRTGKDLIPSQYSIDEEEDIFETMDDDQILSEKKNSGSRIPPKNNEDEPRLSLT